MFIPPTPHFKQFSATVFSPNGFLATVIGSSAGLSEVHRHSRSEVHLVISSSFACPNAPPPIAPLSSATTTPFCA